MKRIILVGLLVFSSYCVAFCQDSDSKVIREYSPEKFRDRLNQLEKSFGKNKIIPPVYELQIYLAVSHYPELADSRIKFVTHRHAAIPLSSRPQFFSMIHRKDKWIYKVVISERPLSDTGISLFRSLPFNAQVGILGHELAHTAYYRDLTFWQVVSIGLRYPFGKFRARFERDTDRRAIRHGLGWQLLDFSEYSGKMLEKKSPKMKEYMARFYLSPDEIRSAMEQSGDY